MLAVHVKVDTSDSSRVCSWIGTRNTLCKITNFYYNCFVPRSSMKKDEKIRQRRKRSTEQLSSSADGHGAAFTSCSTAAATLNFLARVVAKMQRATTADTWAQAFFYLKEPRVTCAV